MLFTKELISGKDIDLTKYNLGIIKQPTVDMFMGNLEIHEFMKPFYFERILKVNEALVEELPFTTCLMVGRESNIGKLIIDSLIVLYGTNEINYDENLNTIIIKKDKKAIAYINDENYDMLCETLLYVFYFDEPKPSKKEQEYEGDPELIAIVKEMEEQQRKKEREKAEKEAVHFEEYVRRVMHLKNCSYNELKDLTVFQLKDSYYTLSAKEADQYTWMMICAGADIKNPKSWQEKTKIKRG